MSPCRELDPFSCTIGWPSPEAIESHGVPALEIGVRRQTAHERYLCVMFRTYPTSTPTSVQVARDLAREPWDPRYGEHPWSMAESGLWGRLPPRDQADLAA
jgi:hypothetical protein